MNITMNKKTVSPLTLVKTVYASVLEDVYEHFEDYAKVYVTKEDAQAIEPEYILKRNGIQKPEYKAPEATEGQ